MRKNIKRGAILSALVVVAFFLVYLALLATAILEAPQDVIGWLAVVLAGGIFVAMIVGVVLALSQRLKEIDKGEEEDAKKYYRPHTAGRSERRLLLYPALPGRPGIDAVSAPPVLPGGLSERAAAHCFIAGSGAHRPCLDIIQGENQRN